MKHTYKVTPGSMGLVRLLCDMFDPKDINPGGWATPCWVRASPEDVKAMEELLKEHIAAQNIPNVLKIERVPGGPLTRNLWND